MNLSGLNHQSIIQSLSRIASTIRIISNAVYINEILYLRSVHTLVRLCRSDKMVYTFLQPLEV